MIPKIIHYIWLGDKEKTELVQRCIASWHQFMPDWQYVEWNEKSLTNYFGSLWLNNMPIYAQEAYTAHKFAFVSDYIRLWALNQFGGIYMDTDVEVLKPLDDLLTQKAFIGFEESRSHVLGTCVIGAEPHYTWIIDMMKYYDVTRFVALDGKFDMTANTIILSRLMEQKGLLRNGKEQMYGDMHIYPYDYFSPLTSTRVLKCTNNTYCIHHFAGSWQEKTQSQIIKDWIRDHILGPKLTDKIVQVKRLFLK